ncbi:hypothetical protein WKI71_31045 [Streptomyces sp. MS1.AVA.1]|uniref:Uncharacterized protein n=1 Tax=Streptomyces machairae TaxID=3134109 RepID=A0ABU8UQP1_9ACTN
MSSWAELLRAYERWTVLDDERTVEDYCRELMGAQPSGLARTGSEPHPLFTDLVEKIAPRQLELLADRREQGGERVEGWVRPLWEFWAETLPAALDTEFGDQRAVQPTLRTLLEHVRGGTRPAPAPRTASRNPAAALRTTTSAPPRSTPSTPGTPTDATTATGTRTPTSERGAGVGTATTTGRTAANAATAVMRATTTTTGPAAGAVVKNRARSGTSGVSRVTVAAGAVAAHVATTTRPAATTGGTARTATDRAPGGASVVRSTAPGPPPGR